MPRLIRESRVWVYLITCEAAHAVKIGYASDVEGRRGDLQVGNPFELTIVAQTISLRWAADEMLLKRHYAKHLLRGEWFHQAPVLDDLLPVFKENRLAEFTASIEARLRVDQKQLRLPMSFARADWKAKFSEMRRKTAAEKRAAQRNGL